MAHHHQHHRSCGVDKQLRKIDEIFMNQKENEVRIIESRTSRNCSVHGSHRRGSVCSVAVAPVKKRDWVVGSSMADLRRPSYGSIYNVGREEEMAKRKVRLANRNSIAHFGDLNYSVTGGRLNPDRRRDSLPVLNKPLKPMEHPSDFPSMLRTTSVSTVDLRRKPSISTRRPSAINAKRSSLNLEDHHPTIHNPFTTSTGKLHSILKNKASSPSKDSETSSDQDLCDLTKRLSFDSGIVKQPLLSNRRNSNDSSSYSSYSRRISIDSLDARRNSRRFSDVSSMFGDEDSGSTCGTGGGIDLDRIRLLNRNFSSSFSGATDGDDKREVSPSPLKQPITAAFEQDLKQVLTLTHFA